jgi:hypothetical protein
VSSSKLPLPLHTPGPWTQQGGVHVTNDYVKGPDGELIAAVYAPAPSANARLIAAAPDLLEALHNMVALAAYYFTDDSQQLALAQARDALAKAIVLVQS